jgi:membrane-associated protease RseP (regulator of RpoE activity)
MEEKKRETPSHLDRSLSFFARRGIWLNVVLFIITIFTTFFFGLIHSLSFLYGDLLNEDPEAAVSAAIFKDPQAIFLAVIYTSVLLGILLGHELGHYMTCRHYSINATLPYFIPAPTLIGTLGAFIKIKSPITRKQQLFDIGIAGPLTGFILSLPALAYGISLSKVIPPSVLPEEGTLMFGEPLLLKILGSLILKDIPAGYDILIHPVAFAGWVGILVTSFNLFPVGQLDGGHISYALIGPAKSRALARVMLAVFIIMGVVFWIGWFLWAFIILVLGLRHPRIIDEETPLSPRRRFMGFIALLIFILSFIPDPLKGYSLFDVFRQLWFR